MTINVSPNVVTTAEFARLLQQAPLHRIIIEITEHLPVEEYATLARTLSQLRQQGMQVAVDDAGGGYASMRHILNLQPDVIKADRTLISDLDTDQARRALVAALVGFADATGALLIAEGVETADELAALRRLGVPQAQGYHVGRPTAAHNLKEVIAVGRRALDSVANDPKAGDEVAREAAAASRPVLENGRTMHVEEQPRQASTHLERFSLEWGHDER